MPDNKKLFLSAVSSEFGSYRNLLTSDLKRPNLELAAQEDFIVTGGSTLAKLDAYIRQCDGVVHLIGKAIGAVPEGPAIAALLAQYPDFVTRFPPFAENLSKPQPGFSYTQWEAYLAIYHQRPLFVYRSADFDLDGLNVPRDTWFAFNPTEAQSQKEHYQRISALGHDRGQFVNHERLSSSVLRDLVEILPRLAADTKADISRIIKYAPAELIGREAETKLLDDAWDHAVRGESKRPHVLTFVALGGEGKTSLVAKWLAELAHREWPGCEAVFAWSFYSQGTREQVAASSDLFLKESLIFFGDSMMANGAQGAFDKGRRLAQLVGERRVLLILDGVEPLQYAPTSTLPGQLKDPGLAVLLKGLAASNNGLCIVTTRYSLSDLKAFWQTTAPEHELVRLSTAAGVALLRSFGVKGTAREFESLVEDVQGHALTLTLLGGFLKRAFKGDIRQRDRVKFETADARIQGGHAFRAMSAYEQWLLEDGGDEGHREVAILKLLGLFDRPADAGCLAALRREPPISGLTEALINLADDEWEFSLSGLESAKLLTVNRDLAGTVLSLDAHPLLREYFAARLRNHSDCSSIWQRFFSRLIPRASDSSAPWRDAHRRLYEHLCATTREGNQPTLKDLDPLYQAVAHGCHAGMHEEAFGNVFSCRISRTNEAYSVHKLGAIGSDLSAIACFFDTPWSHVSPCLTKADQSLLLNDAALRLVALGRLTEALEPTRVSGQMGVMLRDWNGVARSYINLSELELTLGEVTHAAADAEQSVKYAGRSGDWKVKQESLCMYADALHQAGLRAEAETRFCEAKEIQARGQPAMPLLYSMRGFRHCDLLLAPAERLAWQALLNCKPDISDLKLKDFFRAVISHAELTLKIAEHNNWLQDIALNHLTLGRAKFYESILSRTPLNLSGAALDQAVSGLRRAGRSDHLPRSLLTRAWFRFLVGMPTGADSAQDDLDEAWEIAVRGPMKLFLADIHLHRARFFFRAPTYPWDSAATDLAETRRLIEKCGYGRRIPELEDAEVAINEPGRFPDYIVEIRRRESVHQVAEEAQRQQEEPRKHEGEVNNRRMETQSLAKKKEKEKKRRKEAQQSRKRNRK